MSMSGAHNDVTRPSRKTFFARGGYVRLIMTYAPVNVAQVCYPTSQAFTPDFVACSNRGDWKIKLHVCNAADPPPIYTRVC